MEREMKLEEEKLISQMELAKYEHETEMLREREFFNTLLGTSLYQFGHFDEPDAQIGLQKK